MLLITSKVTQFLNKGTFEVPGGHEFGGGMLFYHFSNITNFDVTEQMVKTNYVCKV